MESLLAVANKHEYEEYKDSFTNHARLLFDIGYLEELLFQIMEHKDRLSGSRYKKLHSKLDVAVLEILLRIREGYETIKGNKQ